MYTILFLCSLIVLFFLGKIVLQRYLNRSNNELNDLKKYIISEEVEKIKNISYKDESIKDNRTFLDYWFYSYNYNKDQKEYIQFELYFKYLLNNKTKDELTSFNNYLLDNDNLEFWKVRDELRKEIFLTRRKEDIVYNRNIFFIFIITLLKDNKKLTKKIRRFYNLKNTIWL